MAHAFPNADIDAADISPDALEVAQRNVSDYGLEQHIRQVQSDLFSNLQGQRYDVIISNPPYVSRSDLAAAMPEVSLYEPRLALAGGEDGLEVVRRLLSQAGEKLKPGGALLVEIGASQGQAVIQLAQLHFPGAVAGTRARFRRAVAGHR